MLVRKLFLFIISFLIFLFVPKFVYADSTLQYKSFNSDITINQDTSVSVTETVKVDFLSSHHGIFRNIPGNIKVISVKDEFGSNYKYQVTGTNIKQLKIGDANKTIFGEHTYIINYLVRDAIKEFPDHFELYWNVTGSDWDGNLPHPSSTIHSSYAKIIKIQCFSGFVGSKTEDCSATFTSDQAIFKSSVATGFGSDFTIVVGLDKSNGFIFPSTFQKIINFLIDHWSYLLTPLPFLIPFFFWLKKGRDQRYISDNIYYEPENKTSKTVSFFERKFIPMVYSPIKSLTPAQVGVLIDQKADISDVVAEITELARLKYLKIKRLPKKGLFGKDDYEFTKLNDDSIKLADYQEEIVNGIFETSSTVLMSDLKNKFYPHLKKFKDKLYENMQKNKYFDGNPEKVRQLWLIFVIISIAFEYYFVLINDPVAFISLAIFGVLGFLVSRAMPRRTPKGYALYRQIEGLRFYLKKGLWRQEIAEKNLFIDEILPLAISLGVVKELSKDMQELELKPPTYVNSFATANFVSSFGSFQSGMGSSLASAPGGSGSSGFGGGGFSGGGGGGGGGGGW